MAFQYTLLITSLSRLLGWTYTLLWSLSFYPQLFSNHLNKSTSGLSADFLILNLMGHTFYAIFNLSLLESETVQRQYRQRHGGKQSVVRWNDAVFAIHASLCAAVTLAQRIRYGGERVSSYAKAFIELIALAVTVAAVGRWQALDVVNLLSYIKLLITLVKYMPQVKLNADRHSTAGFSIENILLDLSGGVLSLAQLFLDSAINNDWSAITGDFSKL